MIFSQVDPQYLTRGGALQYLALIGGLILGGVIVVGLVAYFWGSDDS